MKLKNTNINVWDNESLKNEALNEALQKIKNDNAHQGTMEFVGSQESWEKSTNHILIHF